MIGLLRWRAFSSPVARWSLPSLVSLKSITHSLNFERQIENNLEYNFMNDLLSDMKKFGQSHNYQRLSVYQSYQKSMQITWMPKLVSRLLAAKFDPVFSYWAIES